MIEWILIIILCIISFSLLIRLIIIEIKLEESKYIRQNEVDKIIGKIESIK